MSVCFKAGRFSKAAGAAVLAAGLLASPIASAQAKEQFVPAALFRVGPIAAIGIGIAGGWLDYMQLLNDRDGGIYGHKLVWEDCEFEYKPDRSVECYERMKKRVPTGLPFYNPLNTPASYALTERVVQDKVPMLNIGLGRADAADGRVFPWIFPLMTTYQSAVAAKIQYMGQHEGGMAKLKGKKIVVLYHDTAYGKEILPIVDTMAGKFGFEVTKISVPPPGAEQQAQWLQIRQIKPDWIIMRTLGVMTVAAIKNAQRIGFPTDHMIGNWWASSTEDMIAAGDAAKGVIGATLYEDGNQFPLVQEIIKRYYTGGKKGHMADPKLVGSSNYNNGLGQAIVKMEAIRMAMDKYGKKPVTGEQVRWALEHLNLDEKRLKELGVAGMMQPLKTSCADHEGGGAVRFQQWDGAQWKLIGEWVKSDRSIVRPFLEELAGRYAKEKGITPRDCSKES